MKKISVLLIAILSLYIPIKTNAQIYYSVNYATKGPKLIHKSGDLSFLKGQTKLNIEYVYDNMMVGKKPEAQYITEKVEKYNKDEAGKGDKWLESWKNDRTKRFEPKFEELLNKNLEGVNVNVSSSNKDAKYTLILKTVYTDPGYNIGITRKPSYIDVVVTFVETGKKQI